jgi:hypothetical protein
MANGFMQRFKGKISAALIQMQQGGQFLSSTQAGLVASPTHTQAAATLFNAMQVQIATAAVGGCDAVGFGFHAVPGMEVAIVNNGAGAAQIYGLGADTINSVAAATGVSLAAGAVTIYFCFIAGNWVTK